MPGVVTTSRSRPSSLKNPLSRATRTGRSWTAFMMAIWGLGFVLEVTASPLAGDYPATGCTGQSMASGARSPPDHVVGGEEGDDLVARIGGGVRIVAEVHAEQGAIGQGHVEGVGPARVDDQRQGRGRCRLGRL